MLTARSHPARTVLLALVSLVASALTASAQAPGAPIGVSATVNASNVTLSWAPPNNGGTPSGYAIDAGTRSGASDVVSGLRVGNVLSVSAPLPGGTYFVRVRAFNLSGPGPVSTEVMFSVAGPQPPGPPVNLLGTVNGTRVTIGWSAPTTGGTPATYLVDAGTAPGASNVANGLVVGNVLGASAALPAGNYYARVRARNAYGTSAPSNEVQLTIGGFGVPGAPSGLDFLVLGGTVRLSWAAPSTGGAPTGYVIEVGSDRGLSNLMQTAVGNVTTIDAQAPNGVFFVRVRARNASGTSAPSNEVVVVPTPTACTGAFSATLQWDTGSVSGSPYRSDIDLHVIEPGNVHVFYGNRLGTTTQLDRDNTVAFGPENICTRVPPANGTYQVYVVAYSGNHWPATATITVRSHVGTPAERFRQFRRVFTQGNPGYALNVATVSFPSGDITEVTGQRTAMDAGETILTVKEQ